MFRRAVMTATTRHHLTINNIINKSKNATSTASPSRRALAARGQAPRVLSTAAPTLTPKPWGTNDGCVESKGDFRQEAWLESHIGGPLYAHQETLPRLPIPTIQQTLQRFLPTALPLAQSNAERDALTAAVQKFPQQAEQLQQRLQAKAAEYHDSSWLQHWWNTLGYLHVRDTIVINVSYYFHFQDDTTINSAANSNISPQIARAAAMLFTTAQVRNQVVTGTWPPEILGRGDKAKPLCATAYKYMFHACRIPGIDQDTYKIYDPALYTHAAVMCQGHLFKIPLVDPNTHQPVSLPTLQAALQDAQRKAQQAPAATNLGVCTTQNRDEWATARNSLDPTTLQALQTLESAACLVCLDDTSVHTTRQMAHLLLHGHDSANKNNKPLNRWFDKSLQYIVTANGKAGFVGEHSMMDGMPVVTLADKLATTSYATCQEVNQQGNVATADGVAEWILPPNQALSTQTHQHIQQAERALDEWVGKHEIHPKRFNGYGSSWIKKHAKMSPDAYCQMAMQIATYRLWDGQQGGTYEATQVRPFLHGRTETTRSVSTQSAALVQRMGVQPMWHEAGDAAARHEKLQLLRAACDAHVQYIGLAAAAQGVDRHFLGLVLSLQNGETAPDLFADPVYARSKKWRVSTSNLSHPQFVNWGYGEVTPQGVGLSYSIHADFLQFSVTALSEHEWTERLGHHLEEALLELQLLVEAENNRSEQALKSKL